MRTGGGYSPVDSGPGFRGLATSVRATALDAAFSPYLLNCTIRDGVVRRRSGYQQIGQDLIGPVLAITEFGPLNTDPYFVAFTSQRQYYYNTGTNLFVDLTPSQATLNITAVATGGPGTGTFTVAENASFLAAGMLVVVAGSTGNDGTYTVASVSGVGPTIITVDEAVVDATVDGTIDVADAWVSQDGDVIDFAEMTDPTNGRRIIITNGRDAPREWNGSPGTDFSDWAPASGLTGFVTMKSIRVFRDHLFLANIVTASQEETLVAWSDSEDFDDFSTGTSGVQLLAQLKQPIEGMELLGDRLVIYNRDQVINAAFIDLPAVFAFETVIQSGTRLVSPKGIVSIDLGHFYVSEENFYLYDGTRGLREIADAIYTDYKALKKQENLWQTCTLNDYSKRVCYFAIPASEGNAVVYTAEYDVFNLGNLVFAKEIYNDNPRCFGFFTNRTESLTWEDASWEPVNNPWAKEIGTWAEESEQINFPIRAFGTDSGKVMICTEGVLDDAGTIMPQVYETKDFTVPQTFLSQHGRWAEIELEVIGDEIEVAYSTDLGRSFTVLETLTLEYEQRRYRVPLDVVHRTFRVRVRSEEGYFNLYWLRVWVREGPPR